MFQSLSDFYTSRKWRGLLEQLKNERVNADGFVVCEYCGRPIVRAYDIIGHHKKELTPENVNDFTISLNPENVSLVHHRCHNYIHEKLGHSKREVFLVFGAPCSGKTSWVRNNMSEGDLLIDMDEIWRAISGCPLYVKPNRLKSVAFRLRDDLIDVVRYRFGKWENAYIVGGYPLQSERERLIRDLQAREIFIEASISDCIARAEKDDGIDAEEYRGFIEKWFEIYGESTKEAPPDPV